MKPRIVFIKTPDPRGISNSIINGLSKTISARDFDVKVVEPTKENIQDVVNEIIEYKPLFTFDLNLDGLIYAEKDGKKMPLADIVGNIHITWFLDDPMLHYSKLKPILSSNQILYLDVDVEHSQWLGSMGKNVAFLAPGIFPTNFPPPVQEKEFDVVFIGPVTDPSIIENNWKERFDENIYGFAVELGRMIFRNPDMPIRYASGYLLSQFNPQFQEAIVKFQQEKDEEFMAFLSEIGIYAMHLRRWNILDSIEDFDVYVLGPVTGEVKENIIVYEDIVSEKDIVSFISKSKISLLSQPPFLASGLGYTTFNSVACNTLTMVEERLSAKSFFVVDKEIVTYHPMDSVEIEGKIAYYLEENPMEREAIAKAGRDRAFKDHTIINRGEFLANMMKDIIKQASQDNQQQKEGTSPKNLDN
ncbi:glycosyltransferase family protein [Persephonella sp.]